MIRVLFFSRYRELLGCSSIDYPWFEGLTLAGLKQDLIANNGPAWQQVLMDSKLVQAINQQVVQQDRQLKVNDEVAFFPPVTGG